MEVVKVNWSGGKDSTAAALMHWSRGHHVKIAHYTPMFTETIPLIRKNHYDFIMRTAAEFEKMGMEIYITHGIPYNNWARSIIKSGVNKGLPKACPVPITGMCAFARDSKIRAGCENKQFLAEIGKYDYADMGIAADETHRHKQLNAETRSILVELGYTEQDAFEVCKYDYGDFLSPIYDTCSRDGCALCYNAKPGELYEWLEDWPDALPILEDLEKFIKNNRPGVYPLRGYKFWLDDIGGR